MQSYHMFADHLEYSLCGFECYAQEICTWLTHSYDHTHVLKFLMPWCIVTHMLAG